MERKDIVCGVVQAAGEFNKRKLWRRFTNFDCFGVRITGQDETMLGVVLGNAGEEYGLWLIRGPGAAGSFADLSDSEGLGDDAMDELDILSFSMQMFGDLLPEDQALLREAGRHPRFDEQVPHFMAKAPGCWARLPDESELWLLHLVLRSVVEADKKRLLKPARLSDKEGICVLAISGEAAAPHVSVTRERLQHQERFRTIPFLPESFELQGLAHLNMTWLIGMPTIPGGIQGDDRVMQMLLVVDEASEYVFQSKPVFGGDIREAMKIVVETFRGDGLRGQKGLPDKIIFSSRKLFDAMTPILEQEGVRCVYEPIVPKLQAIVADLVAYLDKDFSSFF